MPQVMFMHEIHKTAVRFPTKETPEGHSQDSSKSVGQNGEKRRPHTPFFHNISEFQSPY